MTDPIRTLVADALTPFVYWRTPAPYTASVGSHGTQTLRVVQVTCRTGLAAARQHMLVHRVSSMAAVIIDGCAYFGARWYCNSQTKDAVIVSDASLYGGVCDRCEESDLQGPTVYRFLDTDGILLYVGSTIDLPARRRYHEKHAPWWSSMADLQTERFPNIPAARAAEAVAIRTENPLHNKLLRKRRGSGTADSIAIEASS